MVIAEIDILRFTSRNRKDWRSHIMEGPSRRPPVNHPQSCCCRRSGWYISYRTEIHVLYGTSGPERRWWWWWITPSKQGASTGMYMYHPRACPHGQVRLSSTPDSTLRRRRLLLHGDGYQRLSPSSDVSSLPLSLSFSRATLSPSEPASKLRSFRNSDSMRCRQLSLFN